MPFYLILKLIACDQSLGVDLDLFDAEYKMYTSLYKKPQYQPLTCLLQNELLRTTAKALEPLLGLSHAWEAVGGIEKPLLVAVLELFLFAVFRNHTGFRFPPLDYSWSYVQLFCHCVRHDKVHPIGEYGDLLSIENDVDGRHSSIVIPTKLFVKLCASLTNVADALLGKKDTVALPNEIIGVLNLTGSMTTKQLSPEQIQRYKELVEVHLSKKASSSVAPQSPKQEDDHKDV